MGAGLAKGVTFFLAAIFSDYEASYSARVIGGPAAGCCTRSAPCRAGTSRRARAPRAPAGTRAARDGASGHEREARGSVGTVCIPSP